MSRYSFEQVIACRILVLPLVLGGCTEPLVSTGQPDAGGATGQLVFVRDSALVAVDVQAPGSTLFTVEGEPGHRPGSPVWSPDGGELAFDWCCGTHNSTTYRAGVSVLEVDGGGVRHLAECGGWPAWSPDGAVLALEHAVAVDGHCEGGGIAVVDSDGGPTRMVSDYARGTRPLSISWEPTGTRFVAGGGSAGVAVVVPDLAVDTVYEALGGTYPAWSPDGSTILFTAEVAESIYRLAEILAMAPDGSGRTRLTFTSAPGVLEVIHREVVWSPDGSRVAFVRWILTVQGDLKRGLWVMRRDGSGERMLSAGPAASPAWSPDGAWLAFELDGEIRLIEVETEQMVDLGPGSDPDWRPGGTQPRQN